MATYNIDKFTSPSGDVYKFQDKISGYSKVSVTPTLSSGTKIGTITVDGTGKDLYYQNTITGVKGNAESSYRTGDVNITPANIGLENVNNTSDASKQIYEANLLWGGKNFSASYGPIDAAMVGELGANRLAFIKASSITVEYSRDGGSTWTDYGATDGQKMMLFSNGGYSFGIGKNDSTNKATANGTNYQLRVTINTGEASVYTVLNKFVIYVSTNGSNNCTVTIQKALESSPTNFINHIEDVPIAGWSGYNVINVSGLITYGNTPSSQYGRIRFIFKANGGNTSYNGLLVSRIMGFGGVGWNTPSTMARTNHLYSYDYAQNASFPASVTATQFNGTLNGNASTATSATSATSATKATQDESGNNIKASYAASMSISDHIITLKNKNGESLGTVTVPDNNTTYTFTGGTNKFTVTPSGGTAQDVTVTPSIANNVTGSGTSGYLAKFNGANTITSGPALGTGTTTYLRNDGNWATPTNTTYSAGTGISLSGTTFSNSGVRSIATGSTNGTISVNTGGTSADVAVKGLGSAAYTASTDYATAGHTHSYLPLTGGTVSGSIAISTVGRGFNLTDSSGTVYGGIYENGDNLWIGAASSTSPHHRGSSGNTYISAGYNTTNSAGNGTIYISVPSLSGSTWSHTTYGVLHTGNYSSYALPKSGGTLTGTLYVGDTSASYCEVNSSGAVRIRNTTGNAWVQAENGSGVNAIWMNAKTDGTVEIASRTANGTAFALITRANNSTVVTAAGGWVFTGNITFSSTSDLGIIQGYNSTTKYNILRNHANGNVSLSACSAGLYLGYEQTTFVNFLNGKMSLNSQGYLTVARTTANVESGEAEVAASNGTHKIYLYCNSNGTSGIYAYKADGTGYSVISTANGATTSTFNGHATSDLALSGGTLTGTVTINNNVYVYSKDAGGTARILTGCSSDNNMFFGYGSRAGSVGASYFDGHVVYIRSNGAINLQVGTGISLTGGNCTLENTTANQNAYIAAQNSKAGCSIRANSDGASTGLRSIKTAGTARDSWMCWMNSSGTIAHPTSSDLREKDIIGDIPIKEVETVLRKTKLINFIYKGDTDKVIQNGVIAQNLRDVLIDNEFGIRSYLMIEDLESGSMYYDLTIPEEKVRYYVDYSKFTPILWKGWQLHDEDITTLKEENEELKKQIKKLETTLSKISVS